MTADDLRPRDPVVLLAGLTDLVEAVDDGSGLPALQAAAELAAAATRAYGATFVDYGPGGGRVVAATDAVTWLLGQPVDVSDPVIAKLLAGPPVQQVTLDQLPETSARHLRGHGIHRMLMGVSSADGSSVSSLHVYFTDVDAEPDPYERAVVRLLASWAARLYRENAGIPAYPEGAEPTTVGEGLAVVGPDATVRSWSPAAERLTGRPASAAIGCGLPFPVPPVGHVVVHRLAPGRWVQARSTALVGTDASVVTFRETTEPDPRDQARDLFIAVTSHELRTPVTVIRGYADTLVERWDSLTDPARRDAVFVVWQRARELARLVDRLLNTASDVAGVAGGAGSMPFDPAAALRGAVDELTPDLRRALQVRLPAALPKVRGDRASLATVLTELVTNACKYSTEHVDVELIAGADPETVWFRVADRGVGIRPEHAERAFERFWQLERGDQRRHGGVGLGLYLVRRIVERQNGWVSLRPRDGGGTVAEVRLPRVDTNPGEA
jgi:signal transduction histidine kinase